MEKNEPENTHQFNNFRRDEFLEQIEIDSITRTSYLQSRHINAVQTILRSQFPNIGGLFCTTLGASLDFPAAVGSQWMQIIHTGTSDHWLLVAYGFQNAGHIVVYDSLNFQTATRQHTLSCMSSLLKTKEKEMKYVVKSCQRQENGFDCGVFAAAFATSLAFGLDPSKTVYDASLIRRHLTNCLRKGILQPFPTTDAVRSARSTREKVSMCPVFCHCRRTGYTNSTDKFKMANCISCEGRFHKMCETSFPATKSATKEWTCKICCRSNA